MPAQVAIAFVIEFLIFAAILFGAAGRVAWPAGWFFLALFFLPSIWLTVRLAKHDPALLAERMRFANNPDQPAWDKIFLALVGVGFLVWLAVMGLDARFGWSLAPLWAQALGPPLMLVGFWIVDRVFRTNTFAAPVVKAQAERGQTVISTGPYAIVRHPMYSGGALLLIGCGLTLSSLWGVAGALLLIVAIAWRAIGEERTLIAALPDYAAYMRRVRWRLAPGVW